jgi:hypothetical protein
VAQAKRTIVRVQTGVRMEKRILLVLKALAGTLDLSLGDLLADAPARGRRPPRTDPPRSMIARSPPALLSAG